VGRWVHRPDGGPDTAASRFLSFPSRPNLHFAELHLFFAGGVMGQTFHEVHRTVVVAAGKVAITGRREDEAFLVRGDSHRLHTPRAGRASQERQDQQKRAMDPATGSSKSHCCSLHDLRLLQPFDIRFSFAYRRGDNAPHRARQEERQPIPRLLACLGDSLPGPELGLDAPCSEIMEEPNTSGRKTRLRNAQRIEGSFFRPGAVFKRGRPLNRLRKPSAGAGGSQAAGHRRAQGNEISP
jgi:hypothetical protein